MAKERLFSSLMIVAVFLLLAFSLLGCASGNGSSTGTGSSTLGGATLGGSSTENAPLIAVNSVLMAGYYSDNTGENNIPCYWTDTKANPTTLALPSGSISGIADAVGVDNGAVYIGGMYYGSDKINKPCYWTKSPNGEYLCKTPALPTGCSYGGITAIGVSGGNVYMAGFYLDGTQTSIPCYWAGPDSQPVALPTPFGSKGGYVSAIAIDGTSVYTAGYYNSSTGNDTTPYAWKGSNPVASEPSLPVGATVGKISGIAISGGKVYLSGICSGAVLGTEPYYWTTDNSTPTALPINNGGTAKTIILNDSKVCLAGNENNAACVWVGLSTTSSPTDLPLNNVSNVNSSEVNCSAVGGSSIYTAGLYAKADPNNPKSNMTYPCWWLGTNGTKAHLLNIPSKSKTGGAVAAILLQ